MRCLTTTFHPCTHEYERILKWLTTHLYSQWTHGYEKLNLSNGTKTCLFPGSCTKVKVPRGLCNEINYCRVRVGPRGSKTRLWITSWPILGNFYPLSCRVLEGYYSFIAGKIGVRFAIGLTWMSNGGCGYQGMGWIITWVRGGHSAFRSSTRAALRSPKPSLYEL